MRIIGIVLSILFILILNSKTVWFAGLISTAVALWIYAYHQFKVKRARFLTVSIILLASCATLLYMNRDHIKNIHSIKHRSEVWTRTVKLIKDNPLFGVGFGNWHINNLDYVPSLEIENGSYKDVGIYTAHGNLYYNRPHNDFLWIISELGLLGLLSYLSIIIFLFYLILQSIKSESKSDQIKNLLILSGLTCYIIIAQFSYPKERIEQSILLFLLMALTLLRNKSSCQEKSIKFIYISFLVISSISLYIGFSRAKSDHYMKTVKQNKLDDKWGLMLYNLDKVESSFYPFASDGQPILLTKGIAQMHANKSQIAHNSFLEAKKINPNHVFTLSNLGTTHTIQGNIDSAKYYYRAALKINPKFEDPRMNLVALYFNENKIDSAWSEIRKIPITSPHNRMRTSISALINISFEDKLMEAAEKEFETDKINRFINFKQYQFYILYRKSILNKTSLEYEFLKALREFK